MSDSSSSTNNPPFSDGFKMEKINGWKFQSKAVWTAKTGPGVYGGQIMAQAVLAAGGTVDEAYSLNSLNCYFISAAATRSPIQYHVEKVRDGRSYALRYVKAFQSGKHLVNLQCSFQRPDPLQLTFQLPMPNVKPPEAYQKEVEWYREQLLAVEDTVLRDYYERAIVDLGNLPFDARFVEIRPDGQGGQISLWLIKFTEKDVLEDVEKGTDASLSKSIITYISDNPNFNIFPMTALNLTFTKGPRQILASQRASLNHTITFLDHTYDCADWLLYATTCPVAADGRGIAQGRIYTRTGKLIAVTSQEGVFRIDTRKSRTKGKL